MELETKSEFKQITSKKDNKHYYLINTYYKVNNNWLKVNTYFLTYKELVLLGLLDNEQQQQ